MGEEIFTNGGFSLPKFERGRIVTSFDYRDFGSELTRCQRYFCKTYPYRIQPQSAVYSGSIQSHSTEPINPTAHNLQWGYPVELRGPQNVRAYAFNPRTGEIDHFSIGGQFDTERGADFVSRRCEVARDTSRVLHVRRTSGPTNEFPTGPMRIAAVQFVADAEF
jgi:hypothetical protein